MTIDAPVGTVTTWTFSATGTFQSWTVPVHDGDVRIDCYGGARRRVRRRDEVHGARQDRAMTTATRSEVQALIDACPTGGTVTLPSWVHGEATVGAAFIGEPTVAA